MNADQVIEGIGNAVAAAKPAQEYCFLGCQHWSMCMTKAEWSGWVQAIGSIAAIVASVGVSRWLNNKEKRESREGAELAAQINLIPYASRLETYDQRFQTLKEHLANASYSSSEEWYVPASHVLNRPYASWVSIILSKVENVDLLSHESIAAIAIVDAENANALSIFGESLRQLREHLASPSVGSRLSVNSYKSIIGLIGYISGNATIANKRTQKFLEKRNVPLDVTTPAQDSAGT